MKNFILNFGILALLASVFVSCHKEDDSKIIIKKDKHLVSSTLRFVGIDIETKKRDTVNNNLNYEFDSDGRIVKIYDNNGYKEEYDHKSLLMTTYKNGVQTAAGKINVNGAVVCDSALNGSHKKEYSYDESGHINSSSSLFVVDEENSSRYSYSYTWADGNLVSCKMMDGGVHNGAAMEIGAYDYKYEYVNEAVTTPIENKTGLVFFFDNVLDFSPAYGAGTKNLPVKVNGQNIQWTLEDGYPVKVVTDNATATFMWK